MRNKEETGEGNKNSRKWGEVGGIEKLKLTRAHY